MFTNAEIEAALVSENPSEALFRLEQYAREMNYPELAEWADRELHGYDTSSLPTEIARYRTAVAYEITARGAESFNTEVRAGCSDLETCQENGSYELGQEALSGRYGRQPSRSDTVGRIEADEIVRLIKRIRLEARRRFYADFPRKPERTVEYPVPNFAALVPDAALATVLIRRWHEANRDFAAESYLSTIILLGGILEGVLLSRVEQDRPTACRASACPKDRSGSPLPLDEWKLGALIDVCKECGWLRPDAKQFSHTLREYRNFVHPNKERQEGVTFDKPIAKVAWEVVSLALGV